MKSMVNLSQELLAKLPSLVIPLEDMKKPQSLQKNADLQKKNSDVFSTLAVIT